MTAAAVSPAPSATHPVVAAGHPGIAARAVAATLFAAAGLVVTASILAVAMAASMLARGAVLLDSADVAFIRALSPMSTLLALLGVAHLVAAAGLVLGSRTLAAFGIGIGIIDVAAGLLTLIAVALAPTAAVPGAALGVLAILVGTTLAVAARAAEWGVAQAEAS